MHMTTKTIATIATYGNGITTTNVRNDVDGYFFFVIRNRQYIARFDFDSERNSTGAAIIRNDNYVNVSRAYALRTLRTLTV